MNYINITFYFFVLALFPFLFVFFLLYSFLMFSTNLFFLSEFIPLLIIENPRIFNPLLKFLGFINFFNNFMDLNNGLKFPFKISFEYIIAKINIIIAIVLLSNRIFYIIFLVYKVPINKVLI